MHVKIFKWNKKGACQNTRKERPIEWGKGDRASKWRRIKRWVKSIKI